MKKRAMDQITGYVRVDLDGRIVACNPAMLRMLGLESEERAKDLDFWSLAADPEVREKVDEMIRGSGRAENVEIIMSGQDASPICLLANVLPSLDVDGEVEHLHFNLIDISERRKLEQQGGREERMEALGRLACGVAHDFNNLLTAILGYADIVANALGEDSPLQDEMQQIRMAGVKGASLTRQLLTFAKGKVSEVTIVDMTQVVEEMRPLLNQLLGSRIDLTLDLAKDIHPILIDKSQVEQVILNLAINARDSMEGEGRLTLRTLNHRVERSFVLHHDKVHPGEYAMLVVRDTGTGIEPQIMEHLFEPFFTTKKEGKGTGLGLSTVYGTVKQQGGFISVYNEAERGVTFKVSFPSVPIAEPASRALVPAAARDREARTILLAEDDHEVRQLIENELHSNGFTVLSARDGLEALELVESHRGGIRLLLSDVSMPRLDGIELARKFSKQRPSVPILLVSGTAKMGVTIVDLEGPVGYLEKPFTLTQLMEKIETLL